MVWTHPQHWPWIVAAAVAALLGVLWMLARGRSAERQLHPTLLANGQAQGSVRRAVLRGAGALLWAVALLGPAWGVDGGKRTELSRDVVLVVDASRSMRAQDVAPDRWRRVQELAAQMMAAHPGYRYALVLFAAEAWVRVPFTYDHEFLLQILAGTEPESVTPQGTDFAAAFRQVAALAEARGLKRPVAVMVSDGEHTGGADYGPALEAIAARGVQVVTVAVGDQQGAPIPGGDGGLLTDRAGNPVLTRPDREALAQIAEATGGLALDVDSASADMQLLGRALEQLAAREGREVDSVRRIDRAHWLIAAGWLLMAAGYLPLTWLAGAPRRRVATALLLGLGLGLSGCRVDGDAAEAYHQGDYERAARDYAQLAAETGEPAALANLGSALAGAGAYGQAVSAFAAAATRETGPERQAADWFNAGNAAFRQGDYQLATQLYDQALEDRDDPDVRYNRALAQALMVPPPQQQQKQQQQQQDQGGGEQRQAGGEAQPSDQQPEDGAQGQAQAQQGRQQQPNDQGRPPPQQQQQQPGQASPPQPGDQAADGARQSAAAAGEPGDERAPRAGDIGVMLQQRIDMLKEADPDALNRRRGDDEARPW